MGMPAVQFTELWYLLYTVASEHVTNLCTNEIVKIATMY